MVTYAEKVSRGLKLVNVFNYTTDRFLKHYNVSLSQNGLRLKTAGDSRITLLANFGEAIVKAKDNLRLKGISDPYLSPNELASILISGIICEEPIIISDVDTGRNFGDNRELYNRILAAYARLDLLLMFETYHLSKDKRKREKILDSINSSQQFPCLVDDMNEIANVIDAAYRDSNNLLKSLYDGDIIKYM